MKKTARIIFAAILIMICLLVSACSSLTGNWVCDTDPGHEYPETFLLESGDKGSIDGISCTWYSENGILSITEPWEGVHEYKYKFDGNKLVLTFVSGDVEDSESYTYSKK